LILTDSKILLKVLSLTKSSRYFIISSSYPTSQVDYCHETFSSDPIRISMLLRALLPNAALLLLSVILIAPQKYF